ncbi:MAG: biotin--[acetyl-CoA-carboxylase] ligase [Streptococcaceae bacterium]|jgi:BirA family biotin operon repressor/biotin-[acetyl-CoA-carboxylase] ligase|nr:biotin--[acetyl-CoA-carboxylase] ligase [Streptococcaceae bacterium]
MDKLNERIIQAHSTSIKNIHIIEKTPSTMDLAKVVIQENSPTPALFIANEQTKTRGRFQRDYFAMKGKGIYMSALIQLDETTNELPQYTVLAAVALVKAIEKLSNKRPQIKWVNDIYLNHKKITGILAEGITSSTTNRLSHVIVGIGVNYQITQFPEEIAQKAGSLFEENEEGIPSRNALIAEIWNQFFEWLKKDYIAEYKKYSFVLGKKVVFEKKGVVYTGKAVDIDAKGELLVQTNSELLRLSSGEISLAEIDGVVYKKLE